MNRISRRSVVQGIAWSAPAVAVAAAAPALAASPSQLPYPTTPIYRNWQVNMSETATSAGCVITLDAMTDNSTTLGSSTSAGGFWLDADTAGYGDLKDLTFTTTSTKQGLTWTVTQTDGIGTWTYAGETRNANGTSTYTFTYSGPTKMQVHVGLPTRYYINRSIYTGFMAASSASGACTDYRTWTNTTSSTLWGTTSYSGTQTKNM